MEKIKIASIIIFLSIILIFSISLIVVGSVHAGNPISLIQKNCTLETQELVESDGWLNVWNENIIENIYSSTTFIYFSDKYKINNTYPCLCDLKKCYLDINVTRNIQRSEMIFKYGSDAMISIGSLMMIFLIVFAGCICKKKIQNNDYRFTLEEMVNK